MEGIEKMKNELQLALAGAVLLPILVTGCPGDDGNPADSSVAETGADDDGGPTTGGVDTSGTDTGGEESTGPFDPTDGEVPPEWDCPAGEVVYDGHIVLGDFNVASETPIEDLEGVTVINGDLLMGEKNWVNLNFLKCIKEVRGDIQIYSMYFLTDMAGTDALERLGRLPGPCPSCPGDMDFGKGTISISNNPMLTDIDGFAKLAQIGEQDANTMELSPQSLVIRSNPVLETITGFDSLELIYENLIIQDNDVLKDIKGLGGEACGAEAPNKGLQGVGNSFGVSRNDSLCMTSVNCVGGNLVTYDPENSTTTQNDEGC